MSSTPFLDALLAIGSARIGANFADESGPPANSAGTANVWSQDTDFTPAGTITYGEPDLSLDGGSSVEVTRRAEFRSDRVDDALEPPFTFVALVKGTAMADGAGDTAIFTYCRTTSIQDNHGMGVNNDGTAWCATTTGNAAGFVHTARSTKVINDNAVHLVVGTISTTATRIYVDDEEPVSADGSTNTTTLSASDRENTIARSARTNTDTPFNQLKRYQGKLRYVWKLDTEATPEQVASLWAALQQQAPVVTPASTTITVAIAPGGNIDDQVLLFEDIEVVDFQDDEVKAAITIANTAIADIVAASLPSGWTDEGGGVYSCTLRSDEQLAADLNDILIEGKTVGSTTATLVVEDEDENETEIVFTVNAEEPDFSVTVPDGGDYDYGDVAVNASSPQQFRIENTGSADLNIGTVSVTGDYSIDATDDPSDSEVGIGETTTVTVIAEPTEEGERLGVLTIPSDDPDSPYTINLRTNGVASEPFDGAGTDPRNRRAVQMIHRVLSTRRRF